MEWSGLVFQCLSSFDWENFQIYSVQITEKSPMDLYVYIYIYIYVYIFLYNKFYYFITDMNAFTYFNKFMQLLLLLFLLISYITLIMSITEL